MSKESILATGNDPEFVASWLEDKLVAYMTKAIYGKRSRTEVVGSIKVPKDWWNYTKMCLRLDYETKEIEVKTKVNVYALFPELEGIKSIEKFNFLIEND